MKYRISILLYVLGSLTLGVFGFFGIMAAEPHNEPKGMGLFAYIIVAPFLLIAFSLLLTLVNYFFGKRRWRKWFTRHRAQIITIKMEWMRRYRP